MGIDAITDASKIRTGLSIIKATPFFVQACRVWRSKEPTEKDYPTFQHFCEVEKEFHGQAPNAAESGYHYTNSANAPIDRYYPWIDPPHNLSQMSFGTATDHSIITTPAAYAVVVAATTTQTREPTPAPTEMQAMINAAVSEATKNTNNNYKKPPADGWTIGPTESFATKPTQAQLGKTKRKDTKTMPPWKTRWKARSSSGTTTVTADEMRE